MVRLRNLWNRGGRNTTNTNNNSSNNNNTSNRPSLNNILGRLERVVGDVLDVLEVLDDPQAAFHEEGIDGTAQTSSPNAPPPASKQAVRKLPTIIVTPQDLVDPVNRECPICLEETKLGEKLTRLPCAHLYHPACLTHWLQSSPFCPVCRYELPTDDPQYEHGRQHRMKGRKPRYARHELQRLSVKELKRMMLSNQNANKIPQSYHFVDKEDLIQHLIRSNAIDIVSAPEPVPYKLSALRQMKISQLRQTMNDAGVFFNPQDVLEKQDMIDIFLNSGRLDVLMEDDNEMDSGNEHPQQQTQSSSSSMDIDKDESKDEVSSGAEKAAPTEKIHVETVDEHEDASHCDAVDHHMVDEREDKTSLMEES